MSSKKIAIYSLFLLISIAVSGSIVYSFFSKAAVLEKNYFVDSQLGSDSNDGLSQERPWKTLSKVNATTYNPGDHIFLKRGSIWRDRLIVSSSGSADKYIVYSAYGDGSLPNPKLVGSYLAPRRWTLVSPNIWRLNTTFIAGGAINGYGNIGNILFNKSTKVGIKKYATNSLISQGDYYFKRTGLTGNKVTGYVDLYSASNPSTFYNDIELVPGSDGVYIRKNNIRISNLDISAFGIHGVNIAFSENIAVTYNKISMIGGAEQEGGCPTCTAHTRLGNGIQVSGAKNVTVENNNIFQIYDAGISGEYSSPTTPINIRNYLFRYNVVSKADMGMAFWIRPEASTATNIVYSYNKVSDSGKGWGNDDQRVLKDSRGVNFMASYSAPAGNIDPTENVLHIDVVNNSFSNPNKSNIRISNRRFGWIDLNNNTYKNETGLLAHLDLTSYKSDFGIAEYLLWQKQTGKDANSIFLR